MKMLIRLGLAITGLMLAACGTVATPVWSEQAQETQVALAATSEHLTAIAPTVTPAPPTNTPLPEPTATTVPPTATPVPPTEVPTETPIPPTATTEAAAQTVSGDPANGEALFNEMRAEVNFACVTCHYPNQEAQLIGPGLLNIATRAETRVAGETAYEYLHQSIVDPGAYVVEGYPDGLMPRTYAEVFSEEQINDLIAYLFTLK